MATELSDLRDEIAALKGERALLRRRGRAEVAPQVDALVDHYVAAGRALAERAAACLTQGKAPDPFAVYADGVRIDLGPLLGAILTPAQLKRAILLTAVPEQPADRERQIREIDDQLDALELAEERLVCETGADRRPDVRAEIVLAAPR